MITKKISVILLLIFISESYSQTLSLKEAVATGISNYGTIKAKAKYADASLQSVKVQQREYLPDLNFAAQQDYGTVNGLIGPQYGTAGLGIASSGVPLEKQNWNASFGALYLVNVNWEFYTFGRIKEKINLSKVNARRFEIDLEQEKFKHKIKVAAAYLNLLASQRLLLSEQKNLERAAIFQNIAISKVKNGLLPGVDSTIVSAEVSRAKITLNQIKDQVKEQNNKLVALMGVPSQDFVLDSTFITKVPKFISNIENSTTALNPVLQYYKSNLEYSRQQTTLLKKEFYPSFTLFGVYQARASGIQSDYTVNQNSFSQNYLDGINPSRQNYLFGLGLSWNLTSITRVSKKISAQKLITEGLEQEYEMIDQQLKLQSETADTKIKYAMENYREAPKQVQAAQQAHNQKTALYKNGLTTLLDVTQTLYMLNHAENDRDIIYTNVWQSLLMKAAATGDFNLFINEF
jgi:outer membrane protein TolC